MTLTTEQLRAVETTKEFRALLKYMRAIAKAEPESVKEKLELEEGLWRYASQKTIKAIVEHIDALEFALAANREAQPVAWRHDNGPFAGMAITRAKSVADSWIAKGWTVTPLYTAPPAPAVPEEAKLGEMPFLGKNERGYVRGWNDCRAAMLAQPVSSGYKLPDGWIACSEQMPECGKWDHSAVIVSEGNNSFVAYYNKRDGEFLDEPFGASVGNKVTHWMPLPAAPEGGNDHDTRR